MVNRYLKKGLKIPYDLFNKKIKKCVIFIGTTCNNNCIFCSNKHFKEKFKDKSTSEIKKMMFNARKSGIFYLELTGGEPTIRKDIFKLIRYAKYVGFEFISFVTNGRMLSNFEFSKKIVDCGANLIVFSIHGHNSNLHDSFTNVPGSFNQIKKGISNLRMAGFNNIFSNTVITKGNCFYLKDIGKFIHSLGISFSGFSLVIKDPSGLCDFTPSYEQIILSLGELLEYSKKNNLYYSLKFFPEKIIQNFGSSGNNFKFNKD